LGTKQTTVRLKWIPALLIFISSYFPLALILIIKDFDTIALRPSHPLVAYSVAIVTLASCVIVLVAANSMRNGLPVQISKVSGKSGEMFTYTIPYMISFYNFNLGDLKIILCLLIFLSLMFLLALRTQSMMTNPVLALFGFGLYDCQFIDGRKELQGHFISREVFRPGDTCVVERFSDFLYFVTKVLPKEDFEGGYRHEEV
jgi:hypothetical protein